MNRNEKVDLLTYLIENDRIDVVRMKEEMERKNKLELLSMHPFEVWQGKDGMWKTYLPDEKKGRVFRKRKTKEEIQQVIIDYWQQEIENPTVEELYHQWIAKKLEWEEISKATRDRYDRQFKLCFQEFGKRRIKSVDEEDIEDFLKCAIKDHELTQKSFSNLRTLILGIFKYAKKKKYISYSISEVVKDLDISRKAFRRVRRTDEELVFMEDELPKIQGYLETHVDIKNLCLLLLFKTGLRPGEVVALRKENVNGNIISVDSTEICYKDELGKDTYEVRQFPKTEAGIRDVILPEKYLWIIEKIKLLNPYQPYLFMKNGERLLEYQIRNRLQTVCKHCNIRSKSPNKIRKTYSSILLDNGVQESLIIQMMGHTDIATTKGHYYRNRKNEQEKIAVINSVVNL